MSNLAPIILFVYNRLEVLIKTIEALKSNPLAKESTLFIFSDASKNEADQVKVSNVREYIKTIDGFRQINIFHRDLNYGLALNISNGVTYVLEIYDTAIVLEDDIITSPSFLDFMNNSLKIYKHDEDVCQISGYSYLERYEKKYKIPPVYFIKGADCLAWGTWKRSWVSFTSNSKGLANEIKRKKLVNKFNRNGSYNFFSMLLRNASGSLNSWAVNWYAINFLLGRYTLYPLKSFALHIGANYEATNYCFEGKADPLIVNLSLDSDHVYRVAVVELPEVTKAYNTFLMLYKRNIFSRLKNRVLKMGIFN
jgi:hypothetical protein